MDDFSGAYHETYDKPNVKKSTTALAVKKNISNARSPLATKISRCFFRPDPASAGLGGTSPTIGEKESRTTRALISQAELDMIRATSAKNVADDSELETLLDEGKAAGLPRSAAPLKSVESFCADNVTVELLHVSFDSSYLMAGWPFSTETSAALENAPGYSGAKLSPQSKVGLAKKPTDENPWHYGATRSCGDPKAGGSTAASLFVGSGRTKTMARSHACLRVIYIIVYAGDDAKLQPNWRKYGHGSGAAPKLIAMDAVRTFFSFYFFLLTCVPTSGAVILELH